MKHEDEIIFSPKREPHSPQLGRSLSKALRCPEARPLS